MGTVRQKFESQGFEGVRRDHEKLQREVVKLGEANKKLAREAKKAHTSARRGTKETTVSTRDLAKTVAAAATTYLSFGAAVRVGNIALREQIALQDKARNAQIQAGGAQAGFIRNLGPVSPEVARRSVQNFQNISREAGFPNANVVLQAGATILSATGGNRELARNALREVLPIVRFEPDQLAGAGSSLADLARTAGVQGRQGISRISSTLVSGQVQARTPGFEGFRNAVQAVKSGVVADTSGDKFRAIKESIALFAGFGGSIADPEGALTRTLTSEFVTKLQKLLPEFDKEAGPGGKLTRKGTGLQTAFERLKVLQASPELQREFEFGSKTFEKFTARGPLKPLALSLTRDPQSETAKAVRQAFANVTGDPKSVDALLANLQATPQLRLTDAANRSAANVQAFQRGSSAAARVGLIRNMLRETAQNTPGILGDAIERLLFESSVLRGADPIATGRTVLGMRERRILPGAGRADRPLTKSEQDQLELGRRQLEVLENIERSIKGNAANAEFARDPE